MAKQKVYKLAEEDHYYLNRTFYEGYDSYFLRNKARALMAIVEKQEEFKCLIENPEDLSPVEIDAKFVNSLRAEIHFTAFHQYECLFALLFAAYQDLPHWLFLTTYRNEVAEKVGAFVAGEIAEVTDGKEKDLYQFLTNAVYSGIKPHETQKEDAWKKEIEALHWLLIRIAEKFSGNEYNAYKHGLRVMVGGTSFNITALDSQTFEPVEADDATITMSSKDGITILEVDKLNETDQEITYSVHEVTQHFNAYESLVYLENMAKILFTMKNTRLAYLKSSEQVIVTLFSGIDKSEILKLSPPLKSLRKTFRG